MTPWETIELRRVDGVLVVTLARADRLNAFTVRMAAELEAAFRDASDDDDVRAVVVTGAGRAFCAGMDLDSDGNVFGLDETMSPMVADMVERIDDPDIARGVRDTGGRVTLAIFDCKKPVIAAVNGAAVGIGATMTLAMDARIASEDARIGFVFGKIGITPEACSTWFLPRLVGIERALDLTYTGDIISAQEAMEIGLVREVVPADELLDRALALARRFVERRSAVGIALTRQMMYRNSAAAHPLEAHRLESLAVFYTSLADGKEGVAAFREKRDPEFDSNASAMPAFYDEWTSQVR
ncbi:MAG: crotonase/enoyl-CoA hydratase family protein [Acidimicrobiia bacterium]|nr:crotonase/enoyl-CoA hydratase family protein [Acidimicrobiia bacterium]